MRSLTRELRVNLSDEDRICLRKIVDERAASPSRIRRAEVLLSLDSNRSGINATQIANLHRVSPDTVHRIYSRYLKYGLRSSVLASRFVRTVVLSDAERQWLHSVLNDPKSSKRNAKLAEILLLADSDGKNADATQISLGVGVSLGMVMRTLRSYDKSGLDMLPNQPRLFCFRLADKDRDTLHKLLRQETRNTWRRNRVLVLLRADQVGPMTGCKNIGKSTNVHPQTVRRVCKRYMKSGLDAALNLANRRAFQVRLSADERKTLLQLVSGNCTKQIRKRAVVLLNADENVSNKSNKEIAAIASVSIVTVTKICKHFVASGLKQLLTSRLGNTDPRRFSQGKSKNRSNGKKRKIVPIFLTRQERLVLQRTVAENLSGKGRIQRAQILLKIDEFGETKSFREIARGFDVCVNTVCQTYFRYVNNGVWKAIDHEQMRNPTRVFLLNEKQEAHIVRMFEGRPPKGYKKWTLRVLAEQAVARKIVPTVSHETIRKVLRTHLGKHALKSDMSQ